MAKPENGLPQRKPLRCEKTSIGQRVQAQIATYIEIDLKTPRKHFRAELDRGSIEARRRSHSRCSAWRRKVDSLQRLSSG
jgi:hypothetical protein